ncbi:Hypothetical protein R9X50_00237500 [Acrodontium crateriforme]|uniref:Zn(2)-C6 fungal-type domain-containing protein n=1 Tax=Acrodontium crateriforme TaxID=150365 RepID=A0AAQ3M147_9PEZI|nr:Hypothetical protein R9X50_00237500 [Acrodontium crateriforme]
MATGIKGEGNSDGPSAQPPKIEDAAEVEAALKAAKLARKRTKTGCLTCRKRRIKCGEERPVCKNCVKSKRHCEGYHQPQGPYKPSFDFHSISPDGAHITFHAGPNPGSTFAYPSNNFHAEIRNSHLQQHAYHGSYPSQHHPNDGLNYIHSSPPGYPGNGLPLSLAHMDPISGELLDQSIHQGAPNPRLASDFGFADLLEHAAHDKLDQPWSSATSDNNSYKSHVLPKDFRTVPILHHSSPETISQPWLVGAYPRSQQWPAIAAFQLETASKLHFQTEVTKIGLEEQIGDPNIDTEYMGHELQEPVIYTPTHMLIEAAVETQDDDYNDVFSEDEMDMDSHILPTSHHERQQMLSTILETNQISVKELLTRRYDTFLCDGIIDRYRVEQVANPLKNPATARVFAHFISVTGPSLSIFERHPRSTSLLFGNGNIPISKQGLWTYTMPMAALHHQGLLHAMLALASLQIARLTGASTTPSIQHYAWALKRIHHCVGHPQKRLKLTTVAASLLLGFYEVMTADHMKWNMHLAGSKQLLVETDFVGMTRQFKKMKAEKAARDHLGRKRRLGSQSAQDHTLDQIPDIDERMLSVFNGKEVEYESPGHILTSESSIPKPLDLAKFEMFRDLYWWYCKQDAYQSIISGNALLMPFDRWANCPPRAPLGRMDAVYGTFDHLILLLGRLADFSARDRSRKLRQIKENGGQWRPAPGMKMPPPPQTPNAGQNQRAPPTPNPPSPIFYGMAPPPAGNVRMPSSYTALIQEPLSQTAASHDTSDFVDLRVATHEAMEEYGRIRAALHTFSTSLGDAFEPLSSEYQPPVETPFGTAIFYRSYEIGVLWAVYNMAVIIAIRSHPHMPPAAHMAAAVAAQETAFFANEIGRISAGMVPGPLDVPLNPSLGAALCEGCLPSFFAAVQYQDPQQRDSTVRRIMSIARRSGWGTAEVIATGCETSWIKAAAMGRGPPYERVFRHKDSSEDPRINGRWLKEDPRERPDETDDGDRRLVYTKPNARLTWAIGIMGTEDDLAGSS